MKVLRVFAHPEQSSLKGSPLNEGLRILDDLGREWQLSDLYAMKWKAVVDHDGDYDSDLLLRPELAPGLAGITVHYRDQ